MTGQAAQGRSWPVAGVNLLVAAGCGALVTFLLPVGEPAGALIADGLVAALYLVDWGLCPSPSLMSVSRHLPDSLPLGEPGTILWDVTNRTGRRTRVAVADELAPSLRAVSRRFSVTVPGHGSASASSALMPSRRGDFTPNEIVVRTSGPMALAGRQAARSVPGRVRVIPPFRSRKEAELRMERTRLLEVGLRSARFRGGGSDFDQLRDYTVDDESRRIDWSATARAGRPIVRTYRAERNQQVLILLDCGRTMAGRIDGVPRLEHAMDAALALTAVAARTGDRVGLMAFDTQVRSSVPPAGPGGQLRRVVDAIYRLDPVLAETDYRRAFVELAVRHKRRSLVVLMTELADQALSEVLLPHLALLTSRHLVLVVAIRDPQVEGWATTRPATATDAYRQSAAVGALEARDRISAVLGGMGVDVVDALPGRVAGALADYYLDVKARGRL